MINAKKSLGQNFLTDKNIINKILNLVDIKNKNVIEIGPGKGALTNEILKRDPKRLLLIEKDDKISQELNQIYSNVKNVKIYNKDILKFNLEKIVNKDSAIFGNLPYNISSQILVGILKFKKWPPNFNDLVLMFQKELGEKILGGFETKNYGRLSILSNYKLNILKKFLVSNNCFSPKPKITSMVIHFQPKKGFLYKIKDLNNLEKITNILFSNKRKMINKNIRKILNEKEIKSLKALRLDIRPGEIKPEIYYKITEIFERKMNL